VVALSEVMLIAAADFLAPTAVLLMVFGVVASIAQNPPRFVPDRILPDLKRISLGAGLSRVFGPKGWTEFFKSALKIVAVAVVVVTILGGQRYVLTAAMFLDVADLPQRILKLCVHVIAAVMVATLVVASADLAWARIHWRRDQRMSRHELKEELKQTEGDRLMKARLRSLRLDRSRKRMLSAVPKATMVIVNPTHYAVAMRYVRAEGGAPIVLAKGVDLIALKIREIAEQNSIPIVEDKPLARALYGAVAVDSTIPPEFYRAVAEIVHLIQEKKSSWPLTRNR
jgi:flagellar biosynthetic protein FlhB